MGIFVCCYAGHTSSRLECLFSAMYNLCTEESAPSLICLWRDFLSEILYCTALGQPSRQIFSLEHVGRGVRTLSDCRYAPMPRVISLLSTHGQTLATKEMERGTGSLTGTGTLAVSHASSKREVVITTSRRSSRDDPNVRVSGGGSSMGGSSRGGGYTDDNNGRSPRVNDDEQRSRTSRGGGGRTVERTGSGGGGGGGGTSSRAKRGRSVDSDRGGGGDVGGYAEDYFEEGDPSQAFDSKRMRPADAMQMPVEEGPSRSSVDAGWSRGYGDDAARPRSYGGGGGGGGGSRMQMSQRDMHKDRSPMYDGHGRGGGSGGGVMEGGGYHDDDARGSSRKGGRHDRDRSSNRSEEDGDGGRKDKKKSKKSRSSKDKRRN